MEKLNFGDIVFLKFPVTDNKSYKKNPDCLLKIARMEILLFVA